MPGYSYRITGQMSSGRRFLIIYHMYIFWSNIGRIDKIVGGDVASCKAKLLIQIQLISNVQYQKNVTP